MDIKTICPICGIEHNVQLSSDQEYRYIDFLEGKGHIQDLLPDLSKENRELLLTGICPECWKKMEENEDE